MEQEQEWIPCRVYPGMFSDERAVEVSGQSFFVSEDDVKEETDNVGEVRVTIIVIDGEKWAVIPSSARETVPITT